MARKTENTNFACQNCGEFIYALTNGSYRNHCPFCLYSLHIDNKPGDRLNDCNGLMKPIGLLYKNKKGWQIVHCCIRCGYQSTNKIAIDTIQPDNYQQIARLNLR